MRRLESSYQPEGSWVGTGHGCHPWLAPALVLQPSLTLRVLARPYPVRCRAQAVQRAMARAAVISTGWLPYSC